MKSIFVLPIIITLTAMVHPSCNSSKKNAATLPVLSNKVVVAHRGAWKKKNLPENSLASLREAINLGCGGSEFDVRLTADDTLVINHDPDFANLPIETTPYATLVKHQLSNGEKLPTLYEYLQEGLKNNTTTLLVCEIKPSTISKQRGQYIAEKTIRLVQKMNAQSRLQYISFDIGILKKLLQIDASISTQYLNGDWQPEALAAAHISGLDYHYSVFKNNPQLITLSREKQLTLNAWTVNLATEMDWLLAQHFNYITTNEPELLLQKIKLSK